DSVLIIRHGHLIYERYFNPNYGVNSIHILHSVSKSFTSAIIGVAIDKGLISLDDKVVSFFPDRAIENLDSRKRAMTVEHLLTMTAGFQWDEWSWSYDDPRNDLNQMRSAPDPYKFLLDKPMAAQPGEQWAYNTGCTDLLTEILRRATGSNILDYGREYLFDPLDIDDVTWYKDDRGNYLGGSGLALTPRDMAKFGYLFLNNGTWNGEEVLNSNWVARSTSPHIRGTGIELGLYKGQGYGYLWWSLPEIGVYYAGGRHEQSIYVVQDLDLIVVMTGSVPDNLSGIFPVDSYLLLRYILPACGYNDTRMLECTNNNLTLNYPAGMYLRYAGNASFHQIIGIYSPEILILNWGSLQEAEAELNTDET
ncbi:serine hydrolase, partial [bacterium]